MADEFKPEDLFKDEALVKGNFWKLDHVGARAYGVLVKKTVQANRLKEGTNQTLYHLIQDDGMEIIVAGRYGNPQVISQIESLPLGTLCGVEYFADKPAAKPGLNATKVLKVYRGPFKPEVLNKYLNPMEEMANEEVAF